MTRMLAALTVILLLGSACLGGGDKEQPSAPTESAAEATSTPSSSSDESTGENEGEQSAALGSVFDTLFSSTSGPQSGLGTGDPALADLLPDDSLYPDGFAPFGEFTFSAPDGISEAGKIDMAMAMAVSGDITAQTPDFTQLGMVMAMVMRPEDLQALGDAFGSISELDPEELEAEVLRGIGEADALGVEVSNVEVTDIDLGDGGFSMQMTMDLAGMFGGLLGAGELPEGAPQLESMTMRMHVFANGDYIGAVLRMSFTDSLPAGDAELALARAIDANLESAP